MATVERLEIKKNALVGYKACPGNDNGKGLFRHVNEAGKGVVDWGGIYVQLSVDSAVRYIPNHFERGENEASVVALYALEDIAVLTCNDQRLSNTSISSHDKASLVRQHLAQYDASNNSIVLVDPEDEPLLAGLGEQGVAICLIDSDNYELAMPHALFQEGNLRPETLFVISQNKRIPCTIGSVKLTKLTAGLANSTSYKGDDDNENDLYFQSSDMQDAAMLSGDLMSVMKAHDMLLEFHGDDEKLSRTPIQKSRYSIVSSLSLAPMIFDSLSFAWKRVYF